MLQQDPPAITLDQGPTAVRATAATMGLAPPARRLTIAPLEAIPARLLARPAITLALERTHAPASRDTLEMGKTAHSSTTALGPEEEPTTAPREEHQPAPQQALQHSVVPVTPITPEME